MYDGGKIIPGLVIFLILILSPIWYNAAVGTKDYEPEPEIVTEEEQCVEPTEYMRMAHMDLLNDWRNRVVRKNERYYIAQNGKRYEMSLTLTCMECHSNKADFCDECHDYAGITPYCWDCHIEPEEVQ